MAAWQLATRWTIMSARGPLQRKVHLRSSESSVADLRPHTQPPTPAPIMASSDKADQVTAPGQQLSLYWTWSTWTHPLWGDSL